MAQIIVRNLSQNIHKKLKSLALKNGQSMEEVVRNILSEALSAERNQSMPLGTLFASKFADQGLNEEITELRGHNVEPLNFDL